MIASPKLIKPYTYNLRILVEKPKDVQHVQEKREEGWLSCTIELASPSKCEIIENNETAKSAFINNRK